MARRGAGGARLGELVEMAEELPFLQNMWLVLGLLPRLWQELGLAWVAGLLARLVAPRLARLWVAGFVALVLAGLSTCVFVSLASPSLQDTQRGSSLSSVEE